MQDEPADRGEIEEFLERWVTSKNSPHFAVLLEGRWGCGKTHFITRLLKDPDSDERQQAKKSGKTHFITRLLKIIIRRLLDKNGSDERQKAKNGNKQTLYGKNAVYLSLFGLKDIATLETALFFASAGSAAKWVHRGAGILGAVARGFLRVDINGDGITDGSAEANFNGVDKFIEKTSDTINNSVLILDDLERCSIGMTELLGFVNKYIEHGDTRVILLADPGAVKDKNFHLFREKVTGYSFLLPDDPKAAITSFISEMKKPDITKFIEERQKDIAALHNMSGYCNLRALRQYIWMLSSIIEKLAPSYRENRDLLDTLVREFYIFFVEFKLDLRRDTISLSPRDLNLIEEALFARERNKTSDDPETDEKERKKDRVRETLKKYQRTDDRRLFYTMKTLIPVSQWVSILKTGTVNEDTLNKEIAKSGPALGRHILPVWERLYSFMEQDLTGPDSRKEFDEDIAGLETKLEKGECSSPEEFLHCAGTQIMLSRHGIIDKDIESTENDLKNYISETLVPEPTPGKLQEMVIFL